MSESPFKPNESMTPDGSTVLDLSGKPPRSPHRLRWQIILLGVGLIMIVGAVLFIIAGPRDSRPTVPVIGEFPETQTYTEAIVGQPLWVNPLLATSQVDRDLVSLVFSGLTRVDDYGQPIPDLAESWEVSDDGLTYIFYLRSGVTWHDGTPFTADDVALTMSLLRDPDYPGPPDLGGFWRTVETYAEDETTVRFVLTQPLTAFPEYVGIGILPAHMLAGIDPADLPSDPFNLAPVGTGRLKWESLREEKNLTLVHLVPHSNFYDPARRVRFKDIELHIYSDTNRAYSALGEVQALGGLTPSQLNAVLSNSQINIYSSRLPIYAAIIFNQQEPERLPFLQEELVRLALTMALDRQRLVEENLAQQALPATTPILPGTWAYHPSLTPTPYDPTAAAGMLDEAGWTLEGNTRVREGTRLAFTLLVSNRPVDKQLGEAIREQWSALGVDVTVQTLAPPDLLARLQSPVTEGRGHDFDAALVEFGQGRLADPDPYPFWHESQFQAGQNYSGLDDHDISEALEIARRDPNGVRRAELYRSFQQWFIERAVAIPLYNPVYHYAVSCQVQGVQLSIRVDPSDRFRNMHEWQILSPAEAVQFCTE